MKLRHIIENDQESDYYGLEDDDQFSDGCVDCGIGSNAADIIRWRYSHRQHEPEEVCTDCIEDRPLREWIINKSPEEMTIKLEKLIEHELAKSCQAYGIGGNRLRDGSPAGADNGLAGIDKFQQIGDNIVANFTSQAQASLRTKPTVAANIIAARIVAAQLAASTNRV